MITGNGDARLGGGPPSRRRSADGSAGGPPQLRELNRADVEVVPVRVLVSGGRTRFGAQRPAVRDLPTLLTGLRNDPSLRFTEQGRVFLRWVLPRAAGPDGWQEKVDGLPPHSRHALAAVARRCAEDWLDVARRLERLSRGSA